MDSTLRNATDDETCPLYPNTRRRPSHTVDDVVVVVEHAVAVAHRAVARVTADRIMTDCEAHPRTHARKDFCGVDTKPTVRNSRKYPLPPLSFWEPPKSAFMETNDRDARRRRTDGVSRIHRTKGGFAHRRRRRRFVLRAAFARVSSVFDGW